MSLAMSTKQGTAPELKTVCIQRPGNHFETRVGTGTVPEFQLGYVKDGWVHISAQPSLPSVNAAYDSYKLFSDQILHFPSTQRTTA